MSVLKLFRPIRAFAFDVDGVLTDGNILVLEGGQLARTMNIKDGYALQLAVKKGYQIIILSGAIAEPVKLRLQKLGIHDVFMGVGNKLQQLGDWLDEKKLGWDQLLYMGDDIPDREAMLRSALPCAPADAAAEIREISKYISTYRGGQGCVRDVIEKVLKLKGDWELDATVSSR
jgi:3-deoxy-D-manno-octulosonate 8-phosphate phosphatase (KDO 8-P phosphatase)